MLTQEESSHMIQTILGWMMDIQDRVGNIAWIMTKYHREAIEFLENLNEDSQFEDYRTMAINMMRSHAIARNDIYDGMFYDISVDEMGQKLTESVTVSREEKDVRSLLAMWVN